jgi:hypothetical protein
MNYCLLSEAWGNNKIIDNYNDYMNNNGYIHENQKKEPYIITENFENVQKPFMPTIQELSKKQNFLDNSSSEKTGIFSDQVANINSFQNQKLISSNCNNLNTNNQHLYISNLCDDIFLHIKKCEKCQTKLKNELYLSLNNNIHLSAQQSNSSSLGSKGEIKHSASLILDNLQQIIDKNKDIIVLILISVFIILILNLLNNLI